MKNVIQIVICRCHFITYNTSQRIRHLKSKEHLVFCKEMEQKDKNLPVSLLETSWDKGTKRQP
jgi:hypothetical protein